LNTISLKSIRRARARTKFSVVALHLNGDSRADLAATTSPSCEVATVASAAFPFHTVRGCLPADEHAVRMHWLLLEVAPLPVLKDLHEMCGPT